MYSMDVIFPVRWGKRRLLEVVGNSQNSLFITGGRWMMGPPRMTDHRNGKILGEFGIHAVSHSMIRFPCNCRHGLCACSTHIITTECL